MVQLAQALVITSSLLSTAFGQQTNPTQVEVPLNSETVTAVLSFGNVVLQADDTTATIGPGQYTEFAGVSFSALPERTAVVLEGSQTYGFTHAVSDAAGGAVSSPSSFIGDAFPQAIVSGTSSAEITVSPLPTGYIVHADSTTTTILAGQVVTVAGASISALSTSTGIVAHSFTFTLAAPSSTAAVGGSGSGGSSASTTAETTLITGTNTAATTSPPTQTTSAGAGGSSESSSSTSSAGAVTFTSGDLGIFGWLASSIGMLVVAFGL